MFVKKSIFVLFLSVLFTTSFCFISSHSNRVSAEDFGGDPNYTTQNDSSGSTDDPNYSKAINIGTDNSGSTDALNYNSTGTTSSSGSTSASSYINATNISNTSSASGSAGSSSSGSSSSNSSSATNSSSSSSSYDYTPMENIPGFSKSGDFVTYIKSVYMFGIWGIGIAALLMIMIGGFMYITSAGNNASMEKAKGIITDAIIGILMALTAWLLLYIINPELIRIKTSGLTGTDTGGTSTSGTGTLATGCSNYSNTFSSVSGGDKNLECLLIGIANQESGCNPNLTSSAGACGMMQIKPETAGISCDNLKSNPDRSIQLAKQYLDTARSKIQSYSKFNIGSSNSLSGQSVTYGSYTYDTGNDDIIASYNAGFGTNSGGNKKGPFEISSDCPSPITPAWQCNINSSGFAETQNYVIKVQNYQKQCLSK